jgi:ATP-dependent Clp protease protease subunit
MGAVLLTAGTKTKRTCLPHARVMIHQPSGGMQGQFSDMEIYYNLNKQMKKELYDILSNHTGQTFEQIEKDSDRDNWMTATEARDYGLVDEVLKRDNGSD